MKYVVSLYYSGGEAKATKNTWEEVLLFLSKYEWARAAISKRSDI